MKFQHKIGLMAITVCTMLGESVQAGADAAGDKLMKEVAAKYKSLRTLTATITTQDHMGEDLLQDTETVEFAKPNLAHFVSGSLVFTENGIPHSMTPYYTHVISSGTHFWCYRRNQNTWTQQKIKKTDTYILDPSSFLALLFYTPDTFLSTKDRIGTELVHEKADASLENRILGTQKFEGSTCRILEQTLTIRTRPQDNPNLHKFVRDYRVFRVFKVVFVIDEDLLVHRVFRTTVQPKENHPDSQTETITALRVDMPLPAADFTFVPPAGAKLITE